jgi:hypothetical protein
MISSYTRPLPQTIFKAESSGEFFGAFYLTFGGCGGGGGGRKRVNSTLLGIGLQLSFA